MKYNVPFIKPTFPSAEELIKDYQEIVAKNWFTNFGPFEQEFRRQISGYLGDGISTCTVSNATAGLEIAIRQLFLPSKGRGEVIMPSFTFAAGVDVVLGQGYVPVLIDIDDNWQPDFDQASAYLASSHSKVSGILLGNSFGVGNPRIALWEDLAKTYSIPLVIDSAAGFGSLYVDGSKLGTKGDCEVFSFHATKPFEIGEGGAISSLDGRFIASCKDATNFGFSERRKAERIGTNAKLQELCAAIGLHQLRGYEQRLKARRRSLAFYKKELAHVDLTFQVNDENSTVPFVCVAFRTAEKANQVIRDMLSNGIEAKQYYDPVHYQPIMQQVKYKQLSLGRTEELASRIVALPLHDRMEKETITSIARLIDAS